VFESKFMLPWSFSEEAAAAVERNRKSCRVIEAGGGSIGSL